METPFNLGVFIYIKIWKTIKILKITKMGKQKLVF